MTPDEYCQNKTVSSGSSFYYSFLLLPEPKRKALTAVYAFCREVDDIVDECKEEDIARTKLNWWREDLQQAFHGTPQHPVNQALAIYRQQFNLQHDLFEEIINGMEMDLNRQRYPDFETLSLYCYRAAGVVGLLAAEIFGYDKEETLTYARNLGTALQLTNILRDISEDLERDRIYLPQNELQQYGVTEAQLRSGNITREMRELFAYQAQRAESYYERAMNSLPETDRYNQTSGLVMAAIYHAVLDKIIKDNYAVLNNRISVPAWRKIWIAWNTARKEKRRHLQLHG